MLIGYLTTDAANLDLAERLAKACKAELLLLSDREESPEGFLEKFKMLPMLAEVGKFFPKTIAPKDAPCKQVILREGFNLLDFPILQCWPMDGGRFITLPCVVTRDPKTGKRNMGMYRMQVYDGQTTGMHWQRQKNAAEHLRERLRAASGVERG